MIDRKEELYEWQGDQNLWRIGLIIRMRDSRKNYTKHYCVNFVGPLVLIIKLCIRRTNNIMCLLEEILGMIYHLEYYSFTKQIIFIVKSRHLIVNIGFPAHFRHFIFFNVFSSSSRTLWNVRMLVSISSLVNQFWNIGIQFRACHPFASIAIQIRRSCTVAEHETAK